MSKATDELHPAIAVVADWSASRATPGGVLDRWHIAVARALVMGTVLPRRPPTLPAGYAQMTIRHIDQMVTGRPPTQG